jgi:hypothetical protein
VLEQWSIRIKASAHFLQASNYRGFLECYEYYEESQNIRNHNSEILSLSLFIVTSEVIFFNFKLYASAGAVVKSNKSISAFFTGFKLKIGS